MSSGDSILQQKFYNKNLKHSRGLMDLDKIISEIIIVKISLLKISHY